MLLEKIRFRSTNPPPKPAVKTPPPLEFTGIGTEEIHRSNAFRQDRSSTVMATLFAALAAFLLIALWVGTFSKQESMRGYVTAASGSTRLTTRYTGIVENIWVKQGDKVLKGQRLMTLRPEQATSEGSAPLEEQIAAYTAQRANLVAQMEQLATILDAEPEDRARIQSDGDLLIQTLDDQETDLVKIIDSQEVFVTKMEKNLKSGYATRAAFANEQRALIDYRRQLSELRMRKAELSTTRINQRRDLDQSKTQAANQRSEIQNNIHAIESQLEQLKTQKSVDITAPLDGTVVTLPVSVGTNVTFDQFVAAIADPKAPIRIALEAPSKSVGLLNPGDRVVLKYDSFPYKTFGVQYGKVTRVSDAPLSIPDKLNPQSKDANPLKPPESIFLVEVEPETTTIKAYGEDRPILIGSTLTADVVVERRRLIDWVLDPILAMQGRT